MDNEQTVYYTPDYLSGVVSVEPTQGGREALGFVEFEPERLRLLEPEDLKLLMALGRLPPIEWE